MSALPHDQSADVPQHLRALGRANEVRFAMRDVKREVRVGVLSIPAALADPRAQRMRIDDLLSAQTRWGISRTRKLLVTLKVPEGKRIRDLTQRQRGLVAGEFIPKPPPEPKRVVLPPAPVGPRVPAPVQNARVLAALVAVDGAGLTRTELQLRLRYMRLTVPDLDDTLKRLERHLAINVTDHDGYRLYSVGPRNPKPA